MISIIIPTIGRPSLTQAVKSVRQFFSLHPEIQVIVVDNGSIPLSSQQLNVLYEQRCEVTRLDNSSGVAEARNRGIEMCRFEWMYFLDDDDCMLDRPQEDSNFFEFINSDSEFDFAVFSAWENGKPNQRWNNGSFPRV